MNAEQCWMAADPWAEQVGLSRTSTSIGTCYTVFGLSPFPKCIIIMCLSKHKYLFYAMQICVHLRLFGNIIVKFFVLQHCLAICLSGNNVFSAINFDKNNDDNNQTKLIM